MATPITPITSDPIYFVRHSPAPSYGKQFFPVIKSKSGFRYGTIILGKLVFNMEAIKATRNVFQ